MRSLLALVLAPALACSARSSPAGGQEAGIDATADAADESCFPFCGASSSGSSGGGDDGGGDATCSDLKNQAAVLQAPAQSCDPALQNQCSGIVQGICCPVTVTAGNDQAASAFKQAVDRYTAQCDAACLTPVCPTTPTLDCQGTSPSQPSQGRCR